MRPNLAVSAVEYLLFKHAPHLLEQGWKVQIHTKNLRRLGVCCYKPKLILMSEKFCELNQPKKVEEVGIHEIAHALVGPGNGHNEVWKQQARKIGIPNPTRCDSTAIMPQGKYVAVCPNQTCNKVYQFYRKPKTTTIHHCRTCGAGRGRLTPLPNVGELNRILTPPDSYDGDLDLDELTDD